MLTATFFTHATQSVDLQCGAGDLFYLVAQGNGYSCGDCANSYGEGYGDGLVVSPESEDGEGFSPARENTRRTTF